MKTTSAILLFLVLFGCQSGKEHGVATLPYYKDATFTPVWLDPADQTLSGFHKIPSFNLVNQSGNEVTEKTFANKIYVADFFFTSCPGICLKMTRNMKLVQDAFKNDREVMLLSHSVTPQYDSVSVLHEYAERNNVIEGKWHLVTGERNEIYNLGRNFYFVEEDMGVSKSANDFLHTENFVLVDKNRHIRGIYNGLNKTVIKQLIEDIKALKKETSKCCSEG